MKYFSIIIGNAKLMFKSAFFRLFKGRKNSISYPQLITCDAKIKFSKGHISLGKKIRTMRNVYIVAVQNGNIDIGERVFINQNCIMICQKHISVGEGTLIGPNVCIYDHDHRFDKNGVYGDCKAAEVMIGKNCWIGAGAIILKGSVIGDGSIVGAGTVVKGVVSPHSIVTNNRGLNISPIVDR